MPSYENLFLEDGHYNTLVNIATKLGPPSVENLTIDFNDVPVGVEGEKNPNVIPDNLKIMNNPNPFNPGTTVTYEIGEASPVKIMIYNTNGQLVENLFNGYQNAGKYEILWDGKSDNGIDLPSGVYLLNIVTPGKQKTWKMMKIK